MFSYVMGVMDNSLRNLKFSPKFGWVLHESNSLSSFVKEASEEKKGSKKQNQEEMINPFRISGNIKEFISRSGMQGLVPAVWSSIVLALQTKETYVRSYLEIFFSDD
jgi:hypothetical protein